MKDGLFDDIYPILSDKLRVRLERVLAVIGKDSECKVVVFSSLCGNCMLEIDSFDGVIHILVIES